MFSWIRSSIIAYRMGQCGWPASFGPGCQILGPAGINIGAGFSAGPNCLLSAEGGILRIGRDVSMNSNCHINASCGGLIQIGNNCLFGPNVVLRASSHVYLKRYTPIRKQGHRSGEISIGDDVWLCAGVTILPGVVVPRGCVIGAGVTLSKDDWFPEYSVVQRKQIGLSVKPRGPL